MTDEHLIEISQRDAEQQLEMALSAIRNDNTRHLEPNGSCHDCREAFPHDDAHRETRLFCDHICEKSWNEWYQAQIRKFGPGFRISAPSEQTAAIVG